VRVDIMTEIFAKAKNASYSFMGETTAKKNAILEKIVHFLDEKRDYIVSENKKDLENGVKNGLSDALIDRLKLDDKRIDSMISGVKEIIAQDDPVGSIVSGYRRPNGLNIYKVRVPIGVVGIIYESRPNVTIDAAALCIKSGNVCILRGGKEAINSNLALGNIIKEALLSEKIQENVCIVLNDPDRVLMEKMLKAKQYIDIIVPRGGEGLIKYCTENSLIPLVKHDKGLCHVYIDEFADIKKGIDIAYNAKVQRPGVCNAIETLLVHKNVYRNVLDTLIEKYKSAGVEIVGCDVVSKTYNTKLATEEDWQTEYLALKISIKVVDSVKSAIEHINKYGSGHSEAIVTENYSNAQEFLNKVDAAAVYVNASTRFTDGAEFGLGAEIGISTQKLHCRGPMGAFDLTTTKYLIYGNGQVRN
jgi:glutamate-5-semialdehyde dehydrogenase